MAKVVRKVVRKKENTSEPTTKAPSKRKKRIDKLVNEILEEPSQQWDNEKLSRRRNSYEGTFDWTPKRLEAAKMLATGEFSKKEVADAVGISLNGIYWWLTYKKFYGMVERLVLETGLAMEPARVERMKQRANQLDRLINKRLRPMLSSKHTTLAELDVSLRDLINSEHRIIESLEKREKGVDQTVRHIISGDINPDKEKTDLLKDIMSELPEPAAKAFKDTLIKKAQSLIEQKQKKAEESKT